ncbi:MAG TPA: CBS domain-containing protein [Nitrospinota bacterium]|nr:CBS domain-containing protein [Nitrospinota bacterium]
MLVKERMTTKNLITVTKDIDIESAYKVMRKHSIRHLPVVEGKKLIGIVTDRDLRQSLIPWKSSEKEREFYYFSKEVRIEEIMTKDPVTITPDTDIEDAARLIHRYKFGALPVVKDGNLVGIITHMDILEIFIEIMGIIGSSKRIDVIFGKKPKGFEEVSKIIEDNKGEIISIGMSSEKNKNKRAYYFRIETDNLDGIIKTLKEKKYKILDVMR